MGDRHSGASISTVALSYVLSLPRMLAVIVGVRLGVGAADHRADSLDALRLELDALDFSQIDGAVYHADPSCQSDQCRALRTYRTERAADLEGLGS